MPFPASHPALDELERRIEDLRRLEPALRRLRQAQFDPPPMDDRQKLAAAIRLHLVDDDEAARLNDAIDFAGQLSHTNISSGGDEPATGT